MISSRTWCGLLVLVCLSGCAPEGPREFYRESLQTRAELVDSLTFVVDEPSAQQYFTPAYKRFERRREYIRELFESYEKKADVKGAFRRTQRETFKPNELKESTIATMVEAMVAYEEFCRNLAYINVRLGRELKRVDIVLQASIAKKIEDGQNAAAGDFPALTSVLTQCRKMGESVPRVMPLDITAADVAKLGTQYSINYKFITEFRPQDLHAVVPDAPDFKAPPPPAPPAFINANINLAIDRARKLPPLPGMFTASYVNDPREMSIKNETGKALQNVNGLLLCEVGPARTSSIFSIATDDWQANDQRPNTVPVDEGVTKMRLVLTATVGGVSFGYDRALPDPPPKKQQ